MFPHERSLVQEMQGRPFVLLGVNNDDELDTVKASVKKNKINWRSFYDGSGGPIVRAFNIRAFPTIMLIDHNGVIKFDSIRQNLDEEIEKLVSEAEGDGMSGDKIAPEFRTFRDKTGKYRVKAIAQASNDTSVVLRKEDDSTVKMKLKDLSLSDQKYLKTVELEPLDADEPEVTETAEQHSATDESFRKFQDESGKFEVTARFIEVVGDKVTLEKTDGTRIDVPVSKLSEEDRNFVKEQEKKP